ncbi:MAG TPA: MFS transporter, partial [Chlamydiales bacterium]|nr:MFS transporter [Chlamydiales bacterium]
ATYSLSFPLMCGYIPLVTSLSKETMMRLNTYLTLFDFFLLPFFGLIAQKFGKEKVMMLSSLLLGLLILPLFSSLGPATTLTQVVIMRFIVVILGLAFAAPYHAFALEQTPPQNRTTILCLGYTLGSQLIGAPTAAISLWLYQKTGWTGAPALYLLPIALSVPIVLLLARKKSELTNA